MDNDTLDNRDATLALIGSVLFENSVIHSVSHVQPEHIPGIEGRVWGAMLALAQRGVPINSLSIREELGQGYAQRAQGILSDAARATPHVGAVSSYADAVLLAAERRRAELLAKELATAAYNPDADIRAVEAEVAGALLRGYQSEAVYEAETLAAQDLAEVRDWAAAPLGDGQVRGISTGLRALDDLLDGLWPGFMVTAARTSVGKTAFGTRLAVNVSAVAPVYYIGLEHTPVVYWRRMLSQVSGISFRDVKRGLTKAQMHDWEHASAMLRGRTLALYNGSRDLGMIVAAINRQFHKWGRIGLVVVDNLGHVRSGEERRVDELATVSLTLLEMGQRLGTTIMAMHQINRSVEGRDNKRPALSDLRDSGWIEDTADVVGLMYREEYYDPNTENPGLLEYAVAKNRQDGRTGVACLYFNKRNGDITDVQHYA